ncbi:MAG: hypothetical protein ACKV1O_11870 [Saprospiraceae bacterium]
MKNLIQKFALIAFFILNQNYSWAQSGLLEEGAVESAQSRVFIFVVLALFGFGVLIWNLTRRNKK